LKISIPFP
jgi:hypothetical protein